MFVNDWEKNCKQFVNHTTPKTFLISMEVDFFFKLLASKTFAFRNETCAGGKTIERTVDSCIKHQYVVGI